MLSKCKRFLSLLCAIVILIGTYGAYLIPIQSIVNAAENQVLDLDEDVKYFGRTFYEYDVSGNKIYKFSWANSGFQFSFKGKGATITLQGYKYDSNSTVQDPYVKVYINGELATSNNISGVTLDQGRIKIQPDQDNIITVSNLKKGNYTIKVVKCTDGYHNGVSLSKIQLLDVDDIKGEILATQKYYDRQMLIIGDTLVSGYGTLAESQISNTTPYSTQAHEDSTLSFAALAADSFGAENMTIALRNRGIVKNASSTTTHLAKDFFEYLDFFENFNKRSVQYDHTKYNPDVVVISLGLHDAASSVSAATFKPACKDFILQVKTSYPDAKILYTYGFMDNTSNSLAATVKEVVSELNENGYDDIFYLPLSACTDAEAGYQLSTNYYTPTKAAHELRSKELIKTIEEIMGWKAENSLTDIEYIREANSEYYSVSNPVSSDMPVDASYAPTEDTDISIMTYNIMSKNQGNQTYLSPEKRWPLTVRLILSYMPDVVCIQEATDANSGFDWQLHLVEELTGAGYDFFRVRDASYNGLDSATTGLTVQGDAFRDQQMQIGNGLIIFWKSDRFTPLELGRNEYTGDYTGEGDSSPNARNRYWQYVKLKDNRSPGSSREFYVYNIHAYSKPNTQITNAAEAWYLDQMLQELATEISSKTNYPLFVAGDFIADFNIYGDDSQMGNYKNARWIEEVANIDDAGRYAYYTRMADPEQNIDHIFYNNKYIDARELFEIYEGGEGRRLSTRQLLVLHCNFRGDLSFTSDTGKLNSDKSDFSDVSNASTYSLNFTVGANTTVDIYNDNGDVIRTGLSGAQSLSLTLDNKKITHFTMRLKDGVGKVFSVVNISITRTDSVITSARPTVSATNTINSYFVNGAYHLLAGNHVITLNSAGGDFYWNPYATELMTYYTLDLKQGRTVLYVKSYTTGDVYPVYIYRQTDTQDLDSSVLYVDDDFPSDSVSGKVAFFDGENVIFVDRSRAFDSVAAAADAANGDGKCTTIYFGCGDYDVNQESVNVIFTEDVVLLGSNYDVNPVDAQSNRWYLAGRKPESIINGGFRFTKNGDISVAVKGFKFCGVSADGCIRVVDGNSSYVECLSHTQVLDIQNNIFMGEHSGTGALDIIDAGSYAKVTGIIKNNYFKSITNNTLTEEKNSTGKKIDLKSSQYTRAIYIAHPEDLLIERNFFIGYEITFYIRDVRQTGNYSPETTSTSYTVFSNRFEHCGTTSNYLFGVGENDTAHVTYNNNDFIRCGAGGTSIKHAIDFYYEEGVINSNKVLENVTLEVEGNRFMDSHRAMRFIRSNSNLKDGFSSVEDLNFSFTKNAIINPLEANYNDNYFNSIYLNVAPTKDISSETTINPTREKWDFSNNYFDSTFFGTATDSTNMLDFTQLAVTNPGDLALAIRYLKPDDDDVTQGFSLTEANFTPEIRAYDKVVKAFDGAVGAFDDGWLYDFDHVSLPDTVDKSLEIGFDYDYISDIADMDFLRAVTSLREKMTTYDASKKKVNHSMLTTEHLTGEMRGQTSFYSDVRWYCKNRVSFDIRTTYTGDEASFFYKYSNGAMPSGDAYAGISNSMFYTINSAGRSDSVNGILLKFKTLNNVPTIEMHVAGQSGWQEISFPNIVDDLTEFIHIDIIERPVGTMDFYVDGIHFAQVVGTASGDYSFENGILASESNVTNPYYDTISVYTVSGDVVSATPSFTVNNSLVTKQTAIAFSSADTNAANTSEELWPTKLSMEIDNLEIVDLDVSKLTIINDIAAGILYKAWNMTDCVYDDETKTYTYTINKDWIEFFTQKIDVNESGWWESGTFGENGEEVPNWPNRLRTEDYISTDIEEITVAEGYQYIPVCYYPDETFMGYYNVNTSALSGSDGQWTTETADVEAIRKQLGENVRIRLLFRKLDNSTLSLDLSQNLELICFELRKFFTQKIDVNKSDLWEIGTFDGDGNTSNTRRDRLRTNTYISTDIEEITVAEGYQYIPLCYDPNGNFLGYYDVNTSALSGINGKWTTETADVEAIRKQLGENVCIHLLFSKIGDTSTLSPDLSQNLELIRFEPIEGTEDLISRLFRTTVLDDGRILLTFDRGGDSNPVEHDNEDMVQLAKVAVDYALEKGIQPVGIKKSVPKSDEPGKYEAVMPIDGPGYYLVNSTLGSLITTDTYDNKDGTFNLTVYEKNDPPSISKYVYEDHQTYKGWKKVNDEAVGETVEFKLVVAVQDGAYAYTINDTFGEHYELLQDTIHVEQFAQGYDYNSSANISERVYEPNTDYTVSVANNVLTVKFASADAEDNSVGSLEDVPTGSVIVVTYEAKVKLSVLDDQSNVPFQTYATLLYGREDAEYEVTQLETQSNIVNTYLWSVNLFKYSEEVVGVPTPLTGAIFALATDAAGDDKLEFVGSAGKYRLATSADNESQKTTQLESDSYGRYIIEGLDSGTYYVVETEAPSGYAKMADPEPISINTTYTETDVTRTYNYNTYTVNGETFQAYGFVNRAGFTLPSTGAAGRRMFIATGSVIVLSMSILLVTRMRSSKVIFTKTKVAFKKR